MTSYQTYIDDLNRIGLLLNQHDSHPTKDPVTSHLKLAGDIACDSLKRLLEDAQFWAYVDTIPSTTPSAGKDYGEVVLKQNAELLERLGHKPPPPPRAIIDEIHATILANGGKPGRKETIREKVITLKDITCRLAVQADLALAALHKQQAAKPIAASAKKKTESLGARLREAARDAMLIISTAAAVLGPIPRPAEPSQPPPIVIVMPTESPHELAKEFWKDYLRYGTPPLPPENYDPDEM